MKRDREMRRRMGLMKRECSPFVFFVVVAVRFCSFHFKLPRERGRKSEGVKERE